MFSINLYEIDRIFKEKKKQQIPKKKILKTKVKKLLSKRYRDLKHVFLKITFDKLPPHRSYDYKIKLKKKNTLSYNPFYKQSKTKLLITKKYLIKNLSKGFIIPS